MSESNTSESLLELIESSLQGDSDRAKIKRNIRSTLKVFQKGIKLPVSGPSYKLRYRFAVRKWKLLSETNRKWTFDLANVFIEDLKNELSRKEDLNFKDEVDEILLGKYFDQEPMTKGISQTKVSGQGSVKSYEKQKQTWYVTCKCENSFYVILAKNGKSEAEERKIDVQNISCPRYELIYPGDEVQIVPQTSLGDVYSVYILKSTGPSSEKNRVAKGIFIKNLLSIIQMEKCCLNVFDILRTRCPGIWDSIKNDEELFKDEECVRDVMKLSLLLSKKLLETSSSTCEDFLEDFSSSKFFIAFLPEFIENNAHSKDVDVLKPLLENIMKCSPQTATKIFKVAKYLADLMHTISVKDGGPEENSTCPGIEYLVHLGMILAKSVAGYQDVDTTNCSWNELPTIPTEKEICTKLDVRSLQPIKHNEPYDNVEQYFDINFRLLREECFRDLCTGIQNFRNLEKNYDPQKMKLYRITLNSITAADHNTQIILVLCCEEYSYGREKKESSKAEDEAETTCNEMLYGSLLCISLNKCFDSLIWATVVKYEHQQNSHKKTVSVRLCSDRNKKETRDVLLQFSAITNKGNHALMAESPTFYRAFGPSMDRLKEMYNKGNVPLVRELVFANTPSPPEYTQDKEQKCDWSIIFKKPPKNGFSFSKQEQLSPIEQFRHLKESTESVLDETQMIAVEDFLKYKVSLIQGPPGTGKSYLGAKILRLMLSMGIQQRYGGPILIMTYKNSALDHFLEICLEYTPKVIRIGKAGNENLNRINLKNTPKRGIDDELRQTYNEIIERKRNFQFELKTLFQCLTVFSTRTFLQAASEHNIKSLLKSEVQVDDILSQWKSNTAPPEELKASVKKSLKKWLKSDEIQERFENCREKEPKSNRYDEDSRVLPESTNDEQECLDFDAIDVKIAAQERQQDAVEGDSTQENCDTPSENEKLGYDEPLIRNVYIPFGREENEGEQQDFNKRDLWELSGDERVDFIFALQRKIVRRFSETVKLYEKNAKRQQEYLDCSTVSTLKEYDVIVMTVTGAAIRLHLLDQLKPCAVIVEEAAEIIEGQLLSVLPPTIQHLVMLGDQEQLKPRINCYQLRGKKLDCSMFERLINNGMPFKQLGKQCRMQNNIADLLRSLDIYKNLETNFEKTNDNDPPDCVGKSLFFVKHTKEEKKIKGSNSFYNPHEIEVVLNVAKKLMENEYCPNDVTVLCPYSSQVKKMKAKFEESSSDPTHEYYTKLKDIHITTVDSFQGEENNVILLSLVRSNDDGSIGFFKQTNRICVAISRAKCALYIFGNASTYRRTSNKWETIISHLEKKHLVKYKFPFKEESARNCRSKEDEAMDKHLLLLAKEIPADRKILAKFLGIGDSKVQEISSNSPCDTSWQAYELLKHWWNNRNSGNSWLVELRKALDEMGRHDLSKTFAGDDLQTGT
ncbi:NFX1-type zinc finger-containing protein 1-like [Dendronephthya gigantea]|uniref:NFX1-type zinc finger-containing protein 1-like n=1 Tax=Dendronephthya gigantea TaxID=151771 RepID=UPI00106B5520|nr:NFX1-type zinc finger-containing protein 1-like [Dendronephthya gigantea]